MHDATASVQFGLRMERRATELSMHTVTMQSRRTTRGLGINDCGRGKRGGRASETEAAEIYHSYVSRGFPFLSAGKSSQHHNVARFNWRMCAKDSKEVAATGSDLLVLDEAGRIRFDYQFHDPV